MIFEIISTGSKGNAVLLNGSILIDCGVPLKKLEYVKKDLKLVLTTHVHSDHFNPATVRALAKERPTLRWCCCEWMVAPLLQAGVDKRRIDVAQIDTADSSMGFIYENLCIVRPEPLVHDVPNCGWHICTKSETAFYATDTGTLDGVSAPGYDLYLVEANHKQAELEARLAEKESAGVYAYERRASQTHLSEEQTTDWLVQNMGPNSQYVFIHQHKEG